MTISELRNYLNRLHEVQPRCDDWEVAIITSDPSIGARSHVLVRSANIGFDWEHGKLMMTTNQPITKKIGDKHDDN